MTDLNVNGLTFQYPNSAFGLQIDQFKATKGLSALVGQNGAGKSTFFKLLMGLLPLQQGAITINGTPVNRLTGRERLKQIGILFQNPDDQLFNATVKKEVAWSVRQVVSDIKQVDQVVTQTLQRVGLTDQADENPFDLSFSERKLLAFATLLAVNPHIYLMDEPMIALDWHSQSLVMQVLAQLVAEGHQIIVSTHDMDLVARYFNHVLAFSNGRLLFEGQPRELFGQRTLLQQVGLVPPRIMQICAQLGDDHVYLTPEDYAKQHSQ